MLTSAGTGIILFQILNVFYVQVSLWFVANWMHDRDETRYWFHCVNQARVNKNDYHTTLFVQLIQDIQVYAIKFNYTWAEEIFGKRCQ